MSRSARTDVRVIKEMAEEIGCRFKDSFFVVDITITAPAGYVFAATNSMVVEMEDPRMLEGLDRSRKQAETDVMLEILQQGLQVAQGSMNHKYKIR